MSSTRVLLDAIDARGQVAVAFHLPSVRTCASDDQVRGMYFLPPETDLDEIEAIAMAQGGAAMLMRDGSLCLPPACPRSKTDGESLLDAHAQELELIGDRGTLSIGLGRIDGLPPVVLALDLEEDIARGVAIFSTEPTGDGLDLLAAVGARITSTETREDGRVVVHLENRLKAHLDAARLSGYTRTGNCNAFFLTHGRATGKIEDGLVEASQLRIAAGRERLALEVVRIAEDALDEGLSLQMRAPGADSTKPYGDLVPLGFLGAALEVIGDAGGPSAPAARATSRRLVQKLETNRKAGFWGYSTGCIPTSTDTALVSLAGVDPDFDALESLRGYGGGFVPQLIGDDLPGIAMRGSHATEHWGEEDVPTTALLETLRIDAGLPARTDANWYNLRYVRWGGLYFTNPALSIWSVARIAMRFEPEDEPPQDNSKSSDPLTPEERAERDLQMECRRLRSAVEARLRSLRNEDGSFGRFDPTLTNGFAVLALDELGRHDRTVASAQLHVLESWERSAGVETPFHSTLRLPPVSATEEIARQLFLPGTRALENGVHQVTMYEDPHRLIVAAVACLALHVEADPTLPPNDVYKIIHRHPDTLFEQAMRNVTPYCQDNAPIGSGLGGPFSYPARRTTLVKATESALRSLGPKLVSEKAHERVMHAAHRTNGEHIGAATFGLEIRLHDGDENIDFLWHAGRGSNNLAALLNNPDPSSNVRHLASLWDRTSSDGKPPIAFIDNIWFEFDLDQQVDLPPAFFFGPSKLTRDTHPNYFVPQVADNVRRVLEVLQLHRDLDEAMTECVRKADEITIETPVFQTGLMFSRPDAPIRLCFKPQPPPEGPWQLIDEPEVASRSLALAELAQRHGFNTAICVDLGPSGISSRVGLEFHSGKAVTNNDARGNLGEFTNALVEAGTGTQSRVGAFLSSSGWEELDDDGGCTRIINHVKCLVRPGVPTELKGYLALNRSQRPRVG